MQIPSDKLSIGSSKKHNWIFHSTTILKTLFLDFLVYEKLCECQNFLYKENRKIMAFCSLEYGIRWHWTNINLKLFPEIEYTNYYCPIYKALAAIFGRKGTTLR